MRRVSPLLSILLVFFDCLFCPSFYPITARISFSSHSRSTYAAGLEIPLLFLQPVIRNSAVSPFFTTPLLPFAGSQALDGLGRWFGVKGDEDELRYRQEQYVAQRQQTRRGSRRTSSALTPAQLTVSTAVIPLSPLSLSLRPPACPTACLSVTPASFLYHHCF